MGRCKAARRQVPGIAFEWLEKAVEEHDAILLNLHIYRFLDPLRSHPRYKALLRKMNLEP